MEVPIHGDAFRMIWPYQAARLNGLRGFSMAVPGPTKTFLQESFMPSLSRRHFGL